MAIFKNIKCLFCLFFLLFFIPSSIVFCEDSRAEEFSYDPRVRYEVKVGKGALNRIAIDGSRIETVFYNDPSLELSKGDGYQIFLTPIDVEEGNTIDITVLLKNRLGQDLRLLVSGEESQSILIRVPMMSLTKKEGKTPSSISSSDVKALIERLKRHEDEASKMSDVVLPEDISRYFKLLGSWGMDIGGGYKGFILAVQYKKKAPSDDLYPSMFSGLFAKTIGVQLLQYESDMPDIHKVYIIAEK